MKLWHHGMKYWIDLGICLVNTILVRREYLKQLSDYTGRNTILYYSAWLQKSLMANGTFDFGINDNDKTGFMTCIYQLDKTKGLDLILHTPGGDISATESLVVYLQSIFGKDIRVIIPQMAMSAGTMISCSAKEIIMGKHSKFGVRYYRNILQL